MRDCQFGVSQVNYSDSDQSEQKKGSQAKRMYRFSESMLRPIMINGKYIRNDSGNCHVVGNDKILVPRDSHML